MTATSFPFGEALTRLASEPPPSLDLVAVLGAGPARWVDRSAALDVVAHQVTDAKSCARAFRRLWEPPTIGLHVLVVDGGHAHVSTVELGAGSYPVITIVAKW